MDCISDESDTGFFLLEADVAVYALYYFPQLEKDFFPTGENFFSNRRLFLGCSFNGLPGPDF